MFSVSGLGRIGKGLGFTAPFNKYSWLFYWITAIFVVVAITYENILNPLLWHDDIAWEIKSKYWYLGKLREEGRWFIYLWRSIVPVPHASIDLILMLVAWCALCFTVVRYSLESIKSEFIVYFISLLLLLSPQFWAIIPWPHTAAPALIFSEIAMLALYFGRKSHFVRLFEVAAIIVGMMSYQPIALIIVGAMFVRALLKGVVSHTPERNKNADVCQFPFSMLATVVASGIAGILSGIFMHKALSFLYLGETNTKISQWRKAIAHEEGVSPTGLDYLVYSFDSHLVAWSAWLAGPFYGVSYACLIIIVVMSVFAAYKISKRSRLRFILTIVLLLLFSIGVYLIPMVFQIILPFRAIMSLWFGVCLIIGVLLIYTQKSRSKYIIYSAVSILSVIVIISANTKSHGHAILYSKINEMVLPHAMKINSYLSSNKNGELTIVLPIAEFSLGTDQGNENLWFKSYLIKNISENSPRINFISEELFGKTSKKQDGNANYYLIRSASFLH